MYLRKRIDHDETSPRVFLDLCHTKHDLPNWSWEILQTNVLRDSFNTQHKLTEIEAVLRTVSEEGRPLTTSDRSLFRDILLPTLSQSITTHLTQLPDAVYLRQHWGQMIETLEHIHMLIMRDIILISEEPFTLSARLESPSALDTLHPSFGQIQPFSLATLDLYSPDNKTCIATTHIERWTSNLIWISDPEDTDMGAFLPPDLFDELAALSRALNSSDTDPRPTSCTLALSQWFIDTILHSTHPTATNLHQFHRQQAEELGIEKPGLPKKQYHRSIAHARLIEHRTIEDTVQDRLTSIQNILNGQATP